MLPLLYGTILTTYPHLNRSFLYGCLSKCLSVCFSLFLSSLTLFPSRSRFIIPYLSLLSLSFSYHHSLLLSLTLSSSLASSLYTPSLPPSVSLSLFITSFFPLDPLSSPVCLPLFTTPLLYSLSLPLTSLLSLHPFLVLYSRPPPPFFIPSSQSCPQPLSPSLSHKRGVFKTVNMIALSRSMRVSPAEWSGERPLLS